MEARTSISKQDLRAQLKGARRQWLASASAQKDQWDFEICKRLAQVLERLRPGDAASEPAFVALYRAQAWEVNPQSVVSMTEGWSWAYPRVEGQELGFYSPNSEAGFAKGAFGIEEPVVPQAKPVSLDRCAALVAPAVGFDSRGQRLGSGQGFYDRSLQGYSGLKIGLAYSVQIYAGEFPSEEHDVPMDVVITEEAILNNGFDGQIKTAQ